MERRDDASTNGNGENDTAAALRVREEALREYYFSEELIHRLGESGLKIKSWSITSCGVALGFGFTEKQPLLFCLASCGSLVFWYLEALWKVYESIPAKRAREIEEILNKDIVVYRGPRIVESFRSSFNDGVETKKILEVAFYRNVKVPHLFIFMVGILSFISSLIYAHVG